MGRFRNLSASFKAAAFSNNSGLSIPSFSKTSTNGETLLADKEASSSPARFEDSPTPAESPRPMPRTDRAVSRPTSVIYTPPSMDYEREHHIEELRPVFRCVGSWDSNTLMLVLTLHPASFPVTAISSTKKVLTDYLHDLPDGC